MRRERLVARRLQLGESQKAIARAVGVERTTYARWEQGERPPAAWNRRPLAAALGVPLDELDDLLVPGPADQPTTAVEQAIAGLERSTVRGREVRHRSALRLVGRAHEAMGDLAFDRLALAEATQHYHQAHEVGAEIGDPDLAAGAMTQLGDIARRRGRQRAALRLLGAVAADVGAASVPTRVRHAQTAARTHGELGDRASFDAQIDWAEQIAAQAPDEVPGLAPSGPQDVRLERAHGLTMLGLPREALAIYESEQVSFGSDRERGSYLIIRAQALAQAGDLDEGVRLAIDGLMLARSYGPARHASRVQRMHDRLAATLRPSEPKLAELRDALAAP
jgi:transcriptional regulator with XRE-family HTH domain